MEQRIYKLVNIKLNTSAVLATADVKYYHDLKYSWCGLDFNLLGECLNDYRFRLEVLPCSRLTFVEFDHHHAVVKSIDEKQVTLSLASGEYRHMSYEEYMRRCKTLAAGAFYDSLVANKLYMDCNACSIALTPGKRYYIKVNEVEYLVNFEKYARSSAAIFRQDNGECLVVSQFGNVKIQHIYV
jgi:hypothetical protein